MRVQLSGDRAWLKRNLSRHTSDLRFSPIPKARNVARTLIYVLESLVIRLKRISTETMSLDH